MNGKSANILIIFNEMQGHDLHIREDEGVRLARWRSDGALAVWLLKECGVLADGCSLEGSEGGALL